MEKRGNYYPEEKADGFIENEEVVKLLKEIDEIEAEFNKKKKEKSEALEQIRRNCNHHYQFSIKGMYDDTYECKFCGDTAIF
jgi:hypothetical protein